MFKYSCSINFIIIELLIKHNIILFNANIKLNIIILTGQHESNLSITNVELFSIIKY